jgi:hypothetical protein
MGSVFRPTTLSTSNFRFDNLTVMRSGIKQTPIASPVFAGFGPTEDYGQNRLRDENESRARYEREVDEIMNPGDRELVDRVKEVADFYNELHPNLDETRRGDGIREMSSFGNSSYLSSSLPTHFVSHVQKLSEGAQDRLGASRNSMSYPHIQPDCFRSPSMQPEHFHVGRESMSSPPMQPDHIRVLSGHTRSFSCGQGSDFLPRNPVRSLSCE